MNSNSKQYKFTSSEKKHIIYFKIDNETNVYYDSEYDISIHLQGIETHQNIVKIYDVIIEEEEERFLVIMEYCESGSLLDYLLSTQQRIILKNFFYIAQELIEGVEFLHQNSIVHRDLKPKNIFLFQKRNIKFQKLKQNSVDKKEIGYFIKIGDYGVSKLIKQNKSSILGTINYMAPEIFKRNYNEKVDIWSLGVIFHELKTKQQYFTSKKQDYKEIYEQIKTFQTYSDKPNDNIDYLINLCLNINSSFRITAKNLKVKIEEILQEQDYEIILKTEDNKTDQSIIFNEKQQISNLQDYDSQRIIDISDIKIQNVLQSQDSNYIYCNQNETSPHQSMKNSLLKNSNLNEKSLNNSNLNAKNKKNNSSKENSESNRNEIQNSKMTLFNQIKKKIKIMILKQMTQSIVNLKYQLILKKTQNSNRQIEQSLIKQHQFNNKDVFNKSIIEDNSVYFFNLTNKQQTSFIETKKFSSPKTSSQYIESSSSLKKLTLHFDLNCDETYDHKEFNFSPIETLQLTTNISKVRDYPTSFDQDNKDKLQETFEQKQYEQHQNNMLLILQKSSIVTNPKQNSVFKNTNQETNDKNIKKLKGECKYMIELAQNYHKQNLQDQKQKQYSQTKTINYNSLQNQQKLFSFSKGFIYSNLEKQHKLYKLNIKINFLKDKYYGVFKDNNKKPSQEMEKSCMLAYQQKQVIKYKIVDVFKRYREYECKQKIEFKLFSKKEYIYEQMTNYQIFIQLVINKIYHFINLEYFFFFIMTGSIYKSLSNNNNNNSIVKINKLQNNQSFSENIYPQVCILFNCLLQKFLQMQNKNQPDNSHDSHIFINPNQNKSHIQNNYEIIDCLVTIFIQSLNNLEIYQEVYNFAQDFMKPNKRKKEDSYYEFLDQKIYDLRDKNIKVIDDENPFNKIFFYVKDGIGHILISEIQEFHFFKRIDTKLDSKLVIENYEYPMVVENQESSKLSTRLPDK